MYYRHRALAFTHVADFSWLQLTLHWWAWRCNTGTQFADTYSPQTISSCFTSMDSLKMSLYVNSRHTIQICVSVTRWATLLKVQVASYKCVNCKQLRPQSSPFSPLFGISVISKCLTANLWTLYRLPNMNPSSPYSHFLLDCGPKNTPPPTVSHVYWLVNNDMWCISCDIWK